MYAIIFGALLQGLGYLLRTVVLKTVVFGILFFVVTAIAEWLQSAGILPSSTNLNSAFLAMPVGMGYFFDLAALSYGLPLIISAFCSRFVIRRLPVIG